MSNPDGLHIPEKTIAAVVDELAYRAKLNKPSHLRQFSTSEWDGMVDLVAGAMRETKRG